MKKFQLINLSLLSLTLFAGGCASLSKEECLAGNWEQVGYKDANAGYESSRIGSHIEACAKHGAQISRDLYLKGYQDGLKTFCVYDRGVEYGRNGDIYRETCPPESAESFRRGYRLGQQINKVQAQISALEDEINKLEEELAKQTVPYERRRIASDISTKRTLIATLQTQITMLESQGSLNRRY